MDNEPVSFTIVTNWRVRAYIWALHVAVFFSAVGVQSLANWIANRVERGLNRNAWWSAF